MRQKQVEVDEIDRYTSFEDNQFEKYDFKSDLVDNSAISEKALSKPDKDKVQQKGVVRKVLGKIVQKEKRRKAGNSITQNTQENKERTSESSSRNSNETQKTEQEESDQDSEGDEQDGVEDENKESDEEEHQTNDIKESEISSSPEANIPRSSLSDPRQRTITSLTSTCGKNIPFTRRESAKKYIVKLFCTNAGSSEKFYAFEIGKKSIKIEHENSNVSRMIHLGQIEQITVKRLPSEKLVLEIDFLREKGKGNKPYGRLMLITQQAQDIMDEIEVAERENAAQSKRAIMRRQISYIRNHPSYKKI